MERSSKLADLTLVSKYYPVANYSYPRNEAMTRYGERMTGAPDRSSLGSEGSAPGLVDDRSDSEVSVDDDYQYRALTSEIWDTFWQPGDERAKKDEPEIHPQKQYPALIPSPQRRRKRSAEDVGKRNQGWPLPDSPVQAPRRRQPAATYSPFPKPIALPPPGKPGVPSWQSSRPREQPRRPPRPDERLLTPCIQQQPSPVTAVFTSHVSPPDQRGADGPWSAPLIDRKSAASPEPRRPKTLQSDRPSTPAEIQRPKTSQSCRPTMPAEPRRPKSSRSLRPVSPIEISRPKTSSSNRPPTPSEPDTPSLFSPDTYTPMPDASRHPSVNHQRSRSRLTPDPEPRSFFEEDSDCEDEEEEEGARSFFRFHKRSGSDLRRSARHAESEAAPRRRRGRTSPTPLSPTRHNPERKRNGADVFGRMLGRRSR